MTTIRFRRGEKINLPASAPSGMPLWCEDTKELYMGTDDSITPLISTNSNESGNGYITYSVNSGNTDTDGHPDLIEKVSETEIAFKIGGSYPNIGVTFPNGNYYTVSSIANITGFSDDGIYIFVLKENNLVEVGDGTFSATVNAVRVGYVSNDNLVPIMQSSSQDGFTVDAYNPKNNSEKPNGYTLFDRNNSTGISFSWGWGNGLYAILNYIAPIKMTKCQFYAPTSSGSLSGIVRMKAYGSNDRTNWTEVLDTGDMRSTGNIKNSPTFNCHSPGYYTYYKFQVITVNLVGGYSSTTSNLRTINPYYDQEFLGGNITEGIVLPESPENGDLALLINQKPLKPYLRQNDIWVEKQFLKIGQVQRLSGLMGTPISYAFNGQTIISQIVKTNHNYLCSHNIGTDKVQIYGYFNDIVNVRTSNTSEVPNGSGGYIIGDGTERYSNLYYQSRLILVNKLSLKLNSGINGIYMSANGGVISSGVAEIYIKRSF